MLRHLELIDDEAADYGVRMVKLEDQLMSKKYGHRIPPGLGYFRQGNYIKYDGEYVQGRLCTGDFHIHTYTHPMTYSGIHWIVSIRG